MRRAVPIVALAVVVGACDASADDSPGADSMPRYGDPEMLVWSGDWTATAAGDPYPEHRPAEVTCARNAQSLEYGELELDTGLCNYFLLDTSTLADVLPGDRVTVRAFHDELASYQPAVAHMAVTIDGHLVWDQEVSIPADATPYTVDTIADFEAPAGSPAVLHLHNHGVNRYRIIDIRVTPLD